MSCSRLVLAGLLCILAAGCGGRGKQQVERLAVPPFENLSDDAGLGWAGWALSEVVATEITGSQRLYPLRVSSGGDAALAGATSVLRGYFIVAGGRMRVKVERQDLRRNRVRSYFSTEEAFPEGLFRAAGSVARWIEPGARAFDTDNLDALAAFAQGREAEGAEAAVTAFERSVSIDPDFGGAYVGWARALLLRGDRAGLMSVIEKARTRGDRISQLRRIDLELLQSAASNDAALRRKALEALSRVTPADADVFRQLGREASAARRYDSAAGFYRRVTALDPLDQAAWNTLGYTEAARRNLDGARAALLEYRRLAPKDANPLDSLGDVHFHLGAFRDAEKYYLEAHEKDKAFLGGAELYKAARARLMTGDTAGANDIFQRYAAERSAAQDPLGGYRQAQWLYLTGKRAEAVAALTKLASSPAAPDVLSLAASQLAIWSLLNGNRDEAAAWTGKAVGAAGSPGSRRLAALCLALTGSTPPQGALTAEVAKVAAALRALLAQRFADAVPLLKDLSAAADPVGSDRVGVLLAWALIETGRLQDSAPWLETFGVPPAGLEDPLVYFSFPRVFQLRATVLAKQGRQADAAKMREVYRALGGR